MDGADDPGIALIAYHACPLAAPGQGKSGGMNVHVRELARAMSSRGVRVDIFTREHEGQEFDAAGIADGVNVVHLPAGPADAPLPEQFEHLPDFLSGISHFQQHRQVKYIAVHSHYWMSGWVGLRLSEQWRMPHVATFHTLSRIKMQSRSGEQEPPIRGQTETEIIAGSDSVIVFSEHERDSIIRLYNGIPGHIRLVPCGVDLSRFRPLGRSTARTKLGLNGQNILLFVGRIEALKGLDLLIDTAAHLDANDLKVLVVGDDADGSGDLMRLKAMADDLRVGGSVEFIGRVAQDRLPWYYSAADVCVVPSYYESFGLVALESMACGTPVVASRVGGLPTIIQHGKTGYLKSWRCPEAFANSLEMILVNDSLQESMGRAARESAENMSWDAVAGQLLAIYQELSEYRAAPGLA
ncbi:MAG: glycosyltransferase [Chloroflexi bacterium]|nr:glycosyltransferase [Chloroflexota bacterium]